MDIFTREIVGWQVSSRHDKTLVMQAFLDALVNRDFQKPTYIHSDQGVEYTSQDYTDLVKNFGVTVSMSTGVLDIASLIIFSYFSCMINEMNFINLSLDQKKALNQIVAWTKKPTNSHLTVGGYAGVGKTTLMAEYRKVLNHDNKKLKVAFASFTGRATQILNNKLKIGQVIYKQDSISTIHSLIYSPIINSQQHIIGWKLKDKLRVDLIVVDEASMIDQHLWKDLLSFKIPIVAVGDHGQLPPIKGNFNLMENPVIRLEKIHRQAQDNPIIKLSFLARENGFLPVRRYGDRVVKIDKTSFDSGDQIEYQLQNYSPDTIILCGYNHTRVKLNQFIRHHLGFESSNPTSGDRVICLKNNHQKHIFNGMLGTIQSIKVKDKNWYQSEILMDDEDNLFKGSIYSDQFNKKNSQNFTNNRPRQLKGDLFDFGYALTVHKAQGSQAKKVIVFEERFPKMDEPMWRRWLYTAVTRAEEELFIVGT